MVIRHDSPWGPEHRPPGNGQGRQIVFHPILCAIFPVLFFFSHNSDAFDFAVLIRPLIAVTAAAVLLTLILRRALHDPQKAGLITSVAFLWLFSHGYIYNLAESNGYFFDADGLSMPEFVISVVYIAFVFGIVYFYIRCKSVYGWTYFMNVWSMILLALPAVHVAQAAFATRAALEEQSRREAVALEAPGVSQARPLPDIYFIVLDGYGRSDVLKEFYGYDNSDFLRGLKEKGFYVAQDSMANYSITALSVAATLNAEYIDSLVAADLKGKADWRPVRRLLRKNRLTAFLQRWGYSIVSFSTVYYNVDLGQADFYFSRWWYLNLFEMGLIERTPIPWLLRKLGWTILQDWHRGMSLQTLDHLPDATRLEGPKFVYAHVLCPHPPFLFGPRGEAVNPNTRYDLWLDGPDIIKRPGGSLEQYVQFYVGQVQFVEWKIKHIVREVLEKSATPPIIVLHSDHGPTAGPWVAEKNSTSERIRFGILNALHLPNGGAERLYDSISPVNTFRVVLNHYFGAQYDLLEDRHYWADPASPYEWVPAHLDLHPDATSDSAE